MASDLLITHISWVLHVVSGEVCEQIFILPLGSMKGRWKGLETHVLRMMSISGVHVTEPQTLPLWDIHLSLGKCILNAFGQLPVPTPKLMWSLCVCWLLLMGVAIVFICICVFMNHKLLLPSRFIINQRREEWIIRSVQVMLLMLFMTLGTMNPCLPKWAEQAASFKLRKFPLVSSEMVRHYPSPRHVSHKARAHVFSDAVHVLFRLLNIVDSEDRTLVTPFS